MQNQSQSQSPNQSPYVPSYTTDGLLKFPVNGLPHDAKHYNDQRGLDLVYKLQHFMPKFEDPHQLNDEPNPHSEENEKSRVILLSSIRKELINVGVFTLGTVISKKLAARNFVMAPISNLLPGLTTSSLSSKENVWRKCGMMIATICSRWFL